MALIDSHFSVDKAYPKASEFLNWCFHIRHHFYRLLGKLDLGKVQKIGIRLHEGPDEEYEPTGKSDITGNTWHFDFEAFWKAKPKARKRMVADLFLDIHLKMAKKQGWDPAPFKAAHARMAEAGFINEESGDKPVKSPDKKWQARWHYEFGPEKIEYSALVEDASGKPVKKLVLADSPPQERYLRGTLGKIAWISPTKLSLVSKDGETQGSATFKGAGA